MARLFGGQILQVEILEFIKPALAIFPFKSLQGKARRKEAILQEQSVGGF